MKNNLIVSVPEVRLEIPQLCNDTLRLKENGCKYAADFYKSVVLKGNF